MAPWWMTYPRGSYPGLVAVEQGEEPVVAGEAVDEAAAHEGAHEAPLVRVAPHGVVAQVAFESNV